MATNADLLTAGGLIQTPFIVVKIGDYEFGTVAQKTNSGYIQYPNYIDSLEITKVNGKVNTYTLIIKYPLTAECDPNYMEKVISSVSQSRAISFSYGDLSAVNYIYKNEEAMITKVKTDFQLESSVLQYTISAVSKCQLGASGTYRFPGYISEKPSNVIRLILKDPRYGLQDILTGMRDMTMVDQYGLIPGDDVAVEIKAKDNMSVLDYLQYLVGSMSSTVEAEGLSKSKFYVLTYCDDTSGYLGGPYFKILPVDSKIDHPEAYELDIGYPGKNYVYNFALDDNENYSLYYEYQKKLHPQEYVSRIDANGDYQEYYAPILAGGTPDAEVEEIEKSWWANVTQYPIKASLTIKGLLRPAVLMSYVRINIIVFGKKQINSGLYIITKQVDKVDGASGYQTTLNLTRIASVDQDI